MTATQVAKPRFSLMSAARVTVNRRCSFCHKHHRAEDRAVMVQGQLRQPAIVCREGASR